MEYKITTPLTHAMARTLRAGDTILLSGTVYTARDAAHKRLCALLDEGKELPFNVQDAVIYYVGPCPAQSGQIIGSAGPTTSYRMDAYAPRLIAKGLTGMAGKGRRNEAVASAMRQYGAVYLGAIGGAGALLASCITAAEIVCYEDLGSEAVRRLTVKDMPLTVIMDAAGGSLYETGPAAYLKSVQK